MALTIRDCCALPSLSMAQVVAGHRGLDRPVDSISVLEWMDLRSVQTQFFLQNEVVITSFYSFRHDVDAQLLAVRRLRESGEVGMILYYVGLILPQVDPRLIRLADELEFPIIMMPPGQMNLRYSEVIREVSEQIQSSRAREPDFAHFILERLASVPEMHRSVSTVLRLLSDHLQMTLVLCDSQFGEYISATWPRSLAVSVRGVIDAYTQDQEGAQGYSVSGCRPVDNTKWRGAQLLAITPQDAPAEADRVAQAAQVVELAAKLWKSYEFDTYSVDLIAAVINEELSEVRRLLRRRGQADFTYDTLWLLAPRQMPEEYKKRTVLLAAQLKAMRAALEERVIRGHAAILDERIAVILQCAPQDGLALLAAWPNGVHTMSEDLPGLVESSANLGLIEQQGDTLTITASIRSSAPARMQELEDAMRALCDRAGGTIEITGKYPGWAYEKESALRDTAVRVWQDQFGQKPKLTAVHAGLECGLIKARYPDMPMLSMGPDLYDVHTPREHVSLSSVARMDAYLRALLRALA